jgi:L-fuconolactonase
MTIDAHVHCWQLSRGDYGWLTPALAPIYRDVGLADWQAQATPCGVTGAVLVQAAPTEAETHYLLQLADVNDCVLGVVGWVDLMALDAPERIARLARYPKLKGLRPMLQDIADADWILQPALEPALHSMVKHGLVFDALIKPLHLSRIHAISQRHPGLQIVIDHCAKPGIRNAEFQPWANEIAQLATQPNVACKLSGLLTEAPAGATTQSLQPWVAHVLQCFGPQRVLWGSDWPVLQLAGRYLDWWLTTNEWLAKYSPAEQTLILDVNARRIYRLV